MRSFFAMSCGLALAPALVSAIEPLGEVAHLGECEYDEVDNTLYAKPAGDSALCATVFMVQMHKGDFPDATDVQCAKEDGLVTFKSDSAFAGICGNPTKMFENQCQSEAVDEPINDKKNIYVAGEGSASGKYCMSPTHQKDTTCDITNGAVPYTNEEGQDLCVFKAVKSESLSV